MNYDQPNLIVENVLTDEEIRDVYEHINNTPDDRQELVSVFSHRAYHNWMPPNVVASLTRAAQTTTITPIVLREVSFARYAKFEEGLPVQLFPHTDETFREPRMTFDVQLKSNIEWPIVVEGREYILKDNQALTFSGTHQVHWRTKREFLEGEFMDLIFCHFSAANYIPNQLGDRPSEHDIIMLDKQKYWENIYNER